MVKQLLQSFSNKKFRYGAFSTLTALIVIAILLVVNLVAGQAGLSYDLTPDKLYSISDKTKEILDGLNEDVTIYALFRTGQENDLFKELLEQYASNSNRVQVVYRDPYLYPQFVESYAKDGEQIPANSVIVESAKRSKVIQASELVTTELNYQTFEEQITSIDIEPQVTNAINYVLQESTAKIYVVNNHNEQAIPDELKKQIGMANFDMSDLNLMTATGIPEDCSILFVTTPSIDWTAEEADMVIDYLQNDGHAIFLVDFAFNKYENMENVLAAYGVALGEYLIVEGDTNNYYQNYPIWLLPNVESHDITQDIVSKNVRVLLANVNSGTRGIEQMSLKKNSTKIEPLLTSSQDAYGKTNPQSESVNKEPGDVDGPFNIGVAVTDTIYTDQKHETKLIVVGSSYLLDSRVAGTNYEFLVNAVNWLQGVGETVYIQPKTGTSATLELNQQQAIYMIAFSLIILPVVILGMGLFVWLRRRNS